MQKNIDVVILTCFTSYEPRVEYVKQFFESQNQKVSVVTTNFIHREKKYRSIIPEGYHLIQTRFYKKNLSFQRLISHYDFAHKAIKIVEILQPQILYVLIPANSLLKVSSFYKKKYHCTLIVDIIDLWPESLPIKMSTSIWPFSIWKKLRDDYFSTTDLVITECDLFAEKLSTQLQKVPHYTVYWPQKAYPYITPQIIDIASWNFLYLGSINNIIDIDSIIRLLNYVSNKEKAVTIHIVGDGEKREYLLNCLKKNHISYRFYGPIYEHSQLQEIAKQCMFGINMMKSNVVVGLTMKAVSYLELGLPLINNLKGDIWDKVEQFNLGINVEQNFEQNFESIFCFEKDYILKMRFNARRFFEDFLSEESFKKQLSNALEYMKHYTN